MMNTQQPETPLRKALEHYMRILEDGPENCTMAQAEAAERQAQEALFPVVGIPATAQQPETETPTPRTDAEIISENYTKGNQSFFGDLTEADFARQIERELAAATAERDRLKRAREVNLDSLRLVVSERDAALAQVAQLREALEKIAIEGAEFNSHWAASFARMSVDDLSTPPPPVIPPALAAAMQHPGVADVVRAYSTEPVIPKVDADALAEALDLCRRVSMDATIGLHPDHDLKGAFDDIWEASEHALAAYNSAHPQEGGEG